MSRPKKPVPPSGWLPRPGGRWVKPDGSGELIIRRRGPQEPCGPGRWHVLSLICPPFAAAQLHVRAGARPVAGEQLYQHGRSSGRLSSDLPEPTAAVVYPEEADHIRHWLAHRVQRPQDKINHALVLGGLQGIGKDSLIEPVKRAVGPWNVAEPPPTQLVGPFNGFAKSVILRISEAHDLGGERWRWLGRGPVYLKLGGRVSYRPDDIEQYEAKRLHANTTGPLEVEATGGTSTSRRHAPMPDRP
jgi:hypothetical protein